MENGENIEKIQRKEGLFGSQKENKLINEFVSCKFESKHRR